MREHTLQAAAASRLGGKAEKCLQTGQRHNVSTALVALFCSAARPSGWQARMCARPRVHARDRLKNYSYFGEAPRDLLCKKDRARGPGHTSMRRLPATVQREGAHMSCR